jgi:hypothetical protein
LDEGRISALAILAIPSQRLEPYTTVVPVTTVQRALSQLGMPILDADAVAKYKKLAKRGLLWRAIRWQLLAMAALVALICLGRQPGRAAAVAAAAVLLATLFGWLVSTSDLQWLRIDYSTYENMRAVPLRVSAAMNALLDCGVPQRRIGVEYLKTDPILFVEDTEEGHGVKRYDLIIW